MNSRILITIDGNGTIASAIRNLDGKGALVGFSPAEEIDAADLNSNKFHFMVGAKGSNGLTGVYLNAKFYQRQLSNSLIELGANNIVAQNDLEKDLEQIHIVVSGNQVQKIVNEGAIREFYPRTSEIKVDGIASKQQLASNIGSNKGKNENDINTNNTKDDDYDSESDNKNTNPTNNSQPLPANPQPMTRTIEPYGNFEVSTAYSVYENAVKFMYFVVGTLALGDTIANETLVEAGVAIFGLEPKIVDPLIKAAIYGGSYLTLNALYKASDSLQREQADARAILIAASKNEVETTKLRKLPHEYKIGLPREVANYFKSIVTIPNSLSVATQAFTMGTISYAVNTLFDFSQRAIEHLSNNQDEKLRIVGDTLQNSTFQDGAGVVITATAIAVGYGVSHYANEKVAKFVLPTFAQMGVALTAYGAYAVSGYEFANNPYVVMGGIVALILLGKADKVADYLIDMFRHPTPPEKVADNGKKFNQDPEKFFKQREYLAWALAQGADATRQTLFGGSLFLLINKLIEEYAHVNLMADANNPYGNFFSPEVLAILFGSNAVGRWLDQGFNQGADRGGFSDKWEFLKGTLGTMFIAPGIPAIILSLGARDLKIANETQLLLGVVSMLFPTNALTTVSGYVAKNASIKGMLVFASAAADCFVGCRDKLQNIANDEEKRGLLAGQRK